MENLQIGRGGLWVSRECLLLLGTGTKYQVGKGRLEGEALWNSQEMGAEDREGCQGCVLLGWG